MSCEKDVRVKNSASPRFDSGFRDGQPPNKHAHTNMRTTRLTSYSEIVKDTKEEEETKKRLVFKKREALFSRQPWTR